MTGIDLVSRPEDVTAEWLTTVLRAAGALPEPGRVTGFDTEPVGTGQVGDSVRFALAYDGAEGPASVVGKFPAADETSRGAAAATRTYEVETRFYQQLRDRVAITTPRPYVALLDLEANEFVLLMNDLAPAVQGDQLAGCDVGAAELAMVEVAKLHAPVWDDATLTELAWLNRSNPETQAFYTQLMSTMYPAFLDRYGDRVEREVVEAGNRLVDRLDDYLGNRPEPHTAAHGDYRLDNMLFGTGGDSPPLAVVDWQTATTGPGLTDASYFLGAGLLPEDRRKHERQLIEAYHQALIAGGVEGYDWDRCWTDYRRFAFGGLIMAMAASMLVERTDRGDDMFMAMATRHCEQILDLEATEFLL